MIRRPEHDLLITIARPQLKEQDVDNLRRLVRLDIDWDYLIATARQHGLLPLLHKNTSQTASYLLPPHTRTTLKQESVANTQSVLYLTSQALKVTEKFGQHGIPTAIFKGPLLSALVYGDVGLRQAGDIDLLIARKHFYKAKDLLEAMGFEMCPQLNAPQMSSHLAFHCEIQFMRDDWFTVVDLHWDLTPRSFVFGMCGGELMERLQTISFAGAEVKTFSATDLLIYQAMHGAKHLWRKLEWISTLAELVRTLDPAAWPTIVERTEKAHATKILGLGLRLVESLFTVTAPSDVLAIFDGDGAMSKFAGKLINGLFVAHARPASTETNVYNLKIMDRRRDAFLSMWRALFVPTISDWEALALPPTLHALYYGMRPLRLTKVYSSSLVRRVTQKSVANMRR